MTVEEASKILKMLLGYLKGEIEPPSPKTIEEAEKFEKEGYECLNMAIRSLEAWGKVKEEIETEIKAYDEIVTFHRGVRIGLKIAEEFIDKHLKEVENGT